MALLTFAWVIVVGFTLLAFISAPPQTETTPAVAGLNRQQADIGQAAFEETCSGCHGEFGEGGPNPSKPGSVIPPISSEGFLAAFTDDTLFNIVSNGLPDRGMAAFSTRNGGPLDNSKIEVIVSYLRHWEANPPWSPLTSRRPQARPTVKRCSRLSARHVTDCTVKAESARRWRRSISHNVFPVDSMHQAAGIDSVSQHVLARMRELTGAQLEAVMNYTYSLSPSGAPVVEAPSADRGDAANGAVLFHSWCTNCHGGDGTNPVGSENIVIVDPAFQASMTDAQLIDAISQGFPKPDDMPAFREILSSQEMSDVLAWLRTFR